MSRQVKATNLYPFTHTRGHTNHVRGMYLPDPLYVVLTVLCNSGLLIYETRDNRSWLATPPLNITLQSLPFTIPAVD